MHFRLSDRCKNVYGDGEYVRNWEVLQQIPVPITAERFLTVTDTIFEILTGGIETSVTAALVTNRFKLQFIAD